MISPATATTADAPADPPPPVERALPPTPWSWRLGIAVAVLAVGGAASLLHGPLGYRVQAAAGILCFIGIAACFSKSLQSVNLKTLLWGIGLQFPLAVAVIHSPQVRSMFEVIGAGI